MASLHSANPRRLDTSIDGMAKWCSTRVWDNHDRCACVVLTVLTVHVGHWQYDQLMCGTDLLSSMIHLPFHAVQYPAFPFFLSWQFPAKAQYKKRPHPMPTVIVPHAHRAAYGRGSLPLHNLVSDSANPHYVSDPLPLIYGIIVALDSSEP